MQYADFVRETTTTTGTGTYSLGGAATGRQTFVAGVGGGAYVTFGVSDGTNWEVCRGTVTDAAPDTLSRDVVLSSSNSGSAVNWGAGTKDIYLVSAAADLQGYPKLHRFTDSTDISIPTTQAGAAQIGQSISMEIPTSGSFKVASAIFEIDATSASGNIQPRIGLKIGSTVYPLELIFSDVTYPILLGYSVNGLTETHYQVDGNPAGANFNAVASIDYMIDTHSLPSGTQTVSLVVWEKSGNSGGILKGTILESLVALAITDCTGG